MSQLNGKNILVGVTGGIAAYKCCELVRRLMDAGATVRVVMTPGAEAFVTPLTFQALSGNPVHTELLDSEAEAGMGHIEQARWADLIIVAPASANFLSRLAQGRADDLLSTLCLATSAEIFIAPAMNQAMWGNNATQKNINLLEQLGIQLIGPASGNQACGDIGMGRMSEVTEIIQTLEQNPQSKPLLGKKVVITAGPTQEALDPVRYLSNYSSGKMGYALAIACRRAGAETILVSGPVNLACPKGVSRFMIKSCEEMHQLVMSEVEGADIFIGTAAVADYRPEQQQAQKIKKGSNSIEIKLIRNPDILADVAALKQNRPFVVGFAAESENLIANAQKKLSAKKLDLIVANDISDKGIGFQSEENQVTILSPEEQVEIPRSAKRLVAEEILKIIYKKLSA